MWDCHNILLQVSLARSMPARVHPGNTCKARIHGRWGSRSPDSVSKVIWVQLPRGTEPNLPMVGTVLITEPCHCFLLFPGPRVDSKGHHCIPSLFCETSLPSGWPCRTLLRHTFPCRSFLTTGLLALPTCCQGYCTGTPARPGAGRGNQCYPRWR